MWTLTDRHLNSSGVEKAGYKLLLLYWTGMVIGQVCLGQRVVLVLVVLTPETSIGKTDSALMIQLPVL